MTQSLHPDLLEILRCPRCKGKVEVVGESAEDGAGLACGACHLLYPIVDGIPNFLIEEARPYAVPAGAEEGRG